MMKRHLVGCLSSVLAVFLVTGCAGTSEDRSGAVSSVPAEISSQTEGTDTSREPYEFTLLVNYDWFSAPGEWGVDLVSKTLKEKFNLTINWVNSGGNPDDRIATMLASNDLPDAINCERDANYMRMAELGVLLDLEPYINKYEGYRNAVDEGTRNLSRINDTIYGVLNWPTNQPNGNGGWMINTKIYEQMGSPELKTLDQLYDYLKKVQAAELTENGGPIVPMQFGASLDLTQLYAAYGEGRSNNDWLNHIWTDPATDQIHFIGEDPKYYDMMAYANRLYTEELMNADWIVEQQDQIKEKMANGRFAVCADNVITGYPLEGANIWYETLNQTRYFTVIEPIAAEGIDQASIYSTSYNTLGWNAFAITTAAKEPERIYEYWDFISSDEGQCMIEYGPKGVLWEEVDENGYPKLFDYNEVLSPERNKEIGLWNWTYPGMTAYTDNSKIALNQLKDEKSKDMSAVWQSEITWKHSKNVTEFVNTNPKGDTDEGIAQKACDDLFKEYIPKMISAKDGEQVKALISELNQKVTSAGFDKTLQFYTTVRDENRKKISG